MRNLWMRVGMTFEITEGEEKIIFDESRESGDPTDLIKKMISEGRFRVDGDTYVPGSAVEDFNRKYGTEYEEDDWECCW